MDVCGAFPQKRKSEECQVSEEDRGLKHLEMQLDMVLLRLEQLISIIEETMELEVEEDPYEPGSEVGSDMADHTPLLNSESEEENSVGSGTEGVSGERE